MKVDQPKIDFKPITIVLDKRDEFIALREARRQAEINVGLDDAAAMLLEKLDNL